jgi:hypothetical protein
VSKVTRAVGSGTAGIPDGATGIVVAERHRLLRETGGRRRERGGGDERGTNGRARGVHHDLFPEASPV